MPVESKATAHVNCVKFCSNLGRQITPGFQPLFRLQRTCTFALGSREFCHWKISAKIETLSNGVEIKSVGFCARL